MGEKLNYFVMQLMNLNNPETLEEANQFVMNLITHETTLALQMSVTAVVTAGVPPLAVKQALNIIRIIFTPKIAVPISVLKQKWHHFSVDVQNAVKGAIIRGLYYEDPIARNFAAVDLMLVCQLDWSIKNAIVSALTDPFVD